MVISAASHSQRRKASSLALGPYQILIIIAVALLLFKGGRISEIMKDVGLGISKFKNGVSESSD